MEIQVEGQWIEVDGDEYKQYQIDKANGKGYDD